MAARSNSLAKFLLNSWHNSQAISAELYAKPVDAKKQRASRQALSRLREAIAAGNLPLDVPAGKALVLDERWQRKSDGRGSEKYFRLRMQESRPAPAEVTTGAGSSWLQLWFPPASWTGWIVEGFETLQRDRSISHKHLYTASRGPDNWLTVASSPVYKLAEKCAGKAVYDEMNTAGVDWMSRDMVYLGLGTGSGMADISVIRELLEQDRSRVVRAVPMDFSPMLLSETVANFYQEFREEIAAGRLVVQPILGDLEQPKEWAGLLPMIEDGASLVVGMFGNTIGHLQYRERSTIKRIFEQLDQWAFGHGASAWTSNNSRMLLGISLQRPGGAPHGNKIESSRRWLNLVTDPLRTLLERDEGEYHTVSFDPATWEEDDDGRIAIAELVRRDGKNSRVGLFLHERLPYKPSDGLTGVVHRYIFVFEHDIELVGREVFRRHHLPDSRWREQGDLQARFTAGEDEVVLCEVTQFKLHSLRPALRRLGMEHTDSQVHSVKLGNTTPYAVLAFAPAATRG